MRYVTLIGLALALIAGCGQEEPAEPVVEEAPAIEEAPTEATALDAVDEPTDEAQQVVEESASEPEPEEDVILLAQADVPAVPVDSPFNEGKHYVRLVPAQPTVGGADKVEVAEFFWYGCPHCFTFEPVINEWAANKPANVRFVRIPAMWNRDLQLHARLFYTEEVLGRNGIIKDPEAFRDALFREYHNRRNPMRSEAAIQKVFERLGVSADDFTRTWNSFEVDQKLRIAQDLARRYSIVSVPTMVVNGKFRTATREAGGVDELMQLIDELVARESAR